MPKWLMWLLAAVCGSCLLCGGTCGLLAYRGVTEYQTASKEATAAADAMIPPMMKTWDSKLLAQNGTDDLTKQHSPEKLAETMTTLKGLFGNFESIDPWTTQNISTWSGTGGASTTAKLRAKARFSKRSGYVQLTIKRGGGSKDWKIDSFYVREN